MDNKIAEFVTVARGAGSGRAGEENCFPGFLTPLNYHSCSFQKRRVQVDRYRGIELDLPLQS